MTKRFDKFLDLFPVGPTIFFGALYVIMPILPEPHLVQKALMLMNGLQLAPIDWFDVVAHSSGGVLALAVYRRSRQVASQENRTTPAENSDTP